MRMKRCLVCLVVSLFVIAAHAVTQTEIYVAGRDGYHTYRIPSLIVARKGAILAFAEGRKNSRSDTGDIDIVLKRSLDGGKSWEPQQVVWDDAGNTCGNPCPVVDGKSGTIWLLLTHNLGEDNEKAIKAKSSKSTRTVWVCKSTDDGKTWSKPVEITNDVKDPAWGWYATGPGVGIQIRNGPHKGRLVIPSDHSFQNLSDPGALLEFSSHSFHSDDGGETWNLGGVIRPKMNECQVVELAEGKGTLLMDMRSYLGESRRAHSFSSDGGTSWSAPVSHSELIEPVCQASILRYTWPERGQKSRILFSNPAQEKKRANMTVRLSYDEAKRWPVAKSLFAGPSGYSSLAVLPDQTIACLYERGESNSYDTITYANFTLTWLTDGSDSIGSHKNLNRNPSKTGRR